MATGTTLTAILGYLILTSIPGSCTADAEPAITAFPGQINLGLTDALDINCSVSITGWTDLAALMLLTLSRTNDSEADQSELATISDFSKGQVNVPTTESLMANGWFDSTDSASISLHWDYPTDQQEGTYICKAEGFDPVGRTVVKTTQVQVTAKSPALADWENKVIQIDKSVKSMEVSVKETKDFVKILIEKNNLLDKIYRTRYSQFETPFSHKHHSYYLYKFAYASIASAQAMCMTIGGYLAEIDDLDEYVAIQNFLKSFIDVDGVMVAGTDEEHEGTWTLPSGEPLPFTDWLVTNRGKDNNCILLWIPEFRMSDYFCDPSTPWIKLRRRFLCEVPQV